VFDRNQIIKVLDSVGQRYSRSGRQFNPVLLRSGSILSLVGNQLSLDDGEGNTVTVRSANDQQLFEMVKAMRKLPPIFTENELRRERPRHSIMSADSSFTATAEVITP
jgi:hypothetical protein